VRTLSLLLVTILSGCVLFGAPPPSTEVVDVAVADVAVDFGGVFDGHSSSSVFDIRVIEPGLMDRVLLQPELLRLDEDGSSIELWTQRLLVAALSGRGAVLTGPPVPGEASPVPPERAPTAALTDVVFVSGHDLFDVIVQESMTGVRVATRQHPSQGSLCPEARLELGYVQLEATVQRLPDRAIAALVHEAALIGGPEDPVVTAPLPDPEAHPEAFCAGLIDLFAATERMRRTDRRYAVAAEALAALALDPLFVGPLPGLGPDDPPEEEAGADR